MATFRDRHGEPKVTESDEPVEYHGRELNPDETAELAEDTIRKVRAADEIHDYAREVGAALEEGLLRRGVSVDRLPPAAEVANIVLDLLIVRPDAAGRPR